MASSPNTYLKRKKIIKHIGKSDRFQFKTNHVHYQPLDQTAAGEMAQDAWPDIRPSSKGLEDSTLPT